jgi:hypothetical protein
VPRVFESVLESLQRDVSAESWHRGLALAQAAAAELLDASPGAWTFRVGLTSPVRVTWTTAGWRCECTADNCFHLVAAACVLRAVDLALVHVPRLLRESPPVRPVDLQSRGEPLPAREATPADPAPAPSTAPTAHGHDDDQGDHVVADEKLLLEPKWQGDGDHFGVSFEATTADGRTVAFTAANVVRAWRSGTYAVTNLAGDVGWLPQDWLEKFGATLEQVTAARPEHGELPRWARPAAAELAAALDATPPPSLAGLRALVGDFTDIPAAPLPDGLRAALRDYQQIGVAWLQFCRSAGLGALLADDMGLGKTLQTLAAFRRRARPRRRPHQRAPRLARGAAPLPPDAPRTRLLRPQARPRSRRDVTLTTYALLRLDADLLQTHPTRGQPWDLVVLDEAHAIKNPDSQTAQAAFQLPRRGPPRPHRHPRREPPQRALEPFLLPQPRPARRSFGLRRALRPPDR